MTNTDPLNSPAEPFPAAVARLREALERLHEEADLLEVEASRKEVYGRFGRSFAPENLPALTAEEYTAFLDFKINHH